MTAKGLLDFLLADCCLLGKEYEQRERIDGVLTLEVLPDTLTYLLLFLFLLSFGLLLGRGLLHCSSILHRLFLLVIVCR